MTNRSNSNNNKTTKRQFGGLATWACLASHFSYTVFVFPCCVLVWFYRFLIYFSKSIFFFRRLGAGNHWFSLWSFCFLLSGGWEQSNFARPYFFLFFEGLELQIAGFTCVLFVCFVVMMVILAHKVCGVWWCGVGERSLFWNFYFSVHSVLCDS